MKSTLLKILSQITEPSGGRVKIYGRVGSLLEVGTGFAYELSGRENIYLSGAILGMKKAEIDRKFDGIVDFAEIGKFIDTPVKRYSSGMYVRLAYAVSAHLEPDILLLDEVLSVGDLSFQRKCMQHAKRLQDSGATILFVSHNMFTIKSMCKRAIYLSGGQVFLDGSVEEAINLYEQEGASSTPSWAVNALGPASSWPIHITDMELFSEEGRPRTLFEYGERMRVHIKFKALQKIFRPNFVVTFIRSDDVACCNYTTALDGFSIDSIDGEATVGGNIAPLLLVSQRYTITVLIWDASFESLQGVWGGASFHVRHELLNTHFGVYHEKAEWHWVNPEHRDQIT